MRLQFHPMKAVTLEYQGPFTLIREPQHAAYIGWYVGLLASALATAVMLARQAAWRSWP